MSTFKPVIAIVSCHKMVDGQPAQAVYQKYIDAIQYYGGNPILLPYTAADDTNFEALMSLVDGIVLTGSYSNVAPMRYGATHVEEKQDLNRDELSFKLLAYSAESGTPLLAVCRGLQEMNVHFNGTLHPDWREVEGFYEQHLEDKTQPLEVQYQPVHDVLIQPEGKLAAFGEEWHVNSLHKQAINKVGEGLFVEAVARDGLVEAISLIKHPFMIGVQWHPELNYAQDGFSKFLFTEFIHYASQTKS
ncbi:gamma-glutamyl-gamma-aminobutyrate hydrolase family protein [Psychrobacter sp. SZ93C1]|uniref:gamma-glutamyl-gamma-aminobutyrate hydrolase family protein n=1 Tax=Psychrobacter sp. SZ93C1 TaxID=2792058 RepID=UPI0018CFCCB6|nr:gamma-glutamyl-gamma-aminobutyrate hydrolase family protein [Psychrobacter sp. SZ93C1]MBH0064360.1 gamma-glutamyl-gamma-aminobutyrate hydrolase family protein [Psychrobacter sp. SZ93C1]